MTIVHNGQDWANDEGERRQCQPVSTEGLFNATATPLPLSRSLHLSAKTAVIETSSAPRQATLAVAVLATLLVAGAS